MPGGSDRRRGIFVNSGIAILRNLPALIAVALAVLYLRAEIRHVRLNTDDLDGRMAWQSDAIERIEKQMERP